MRPHQTRATHYRVLVTLTGFLLLTAALPAGAAADASLLLARQGKAMATIVLADDASAPERTAALELAHYLGKVTGGTFRIVREAAAPKQGTCLYVGPTRFARRNGLDAAKLGPEEWVHHTAAPHLILTGGRPRGTLYSVYRFLEDRIGVHWWTPFDELVPRKPDLKLAARNRRGQPVFRYRDIYMLYGNDGGRFAARNRLNREGDARIDARYGGCMDYGPPYHVHTFYMYLPPEQDPGGAPGLVLANRREARWWTGAALPHQPGDARRLPAEAEALH